MKCNKECEHFAEFGNTQLCGIGLCRRSESFTTVALNQDCAYEFKPYTCKDCNHFQTNDPACMTAQENDDATDCCGFEDANYIKLVSIIFEWKQRGLDYWEMYSRAVEEASQI